MDKLQRKQIRQQILDGTFSGDPISPVIDTLTFLHLTQAGRIELTKFPDAALSYGNAQTRRKKNVADPFKYFCGICSNYCKQNGLYVDMEYPNLLFNFYKVDPNAPRYESKPDIYGQDITQSAPTSSNPVWVPEPRERRHGVTEITKLTLSLFHDDMLHMLKLWGGKDGIFNYFIRMSHYWDEGLSSSEALVEAKAYDAWCKSEFGLQFFTYFKQYLPFWLSF